MINFRRVSAPLHKVQISHLSEIPSRNASAAQIQLHKLKAGHVVMPKKKKIQTGFRTYLLLRKFFGSKKIMKPLSSPILIKKKLYIQRISWVRNWIYIFNAGQLCALFQRPHTQDAKKPHWSESMTNHMKPHISVISCNILHPAIQEAAQ